MRSKTSRFNSLKSVGKLLSRIITAVVSGLPRKEIVFKPEINSRVQNRKENIKTDNEKHYHHPISKPVVEKQTIIKEKKKVKAVH